MGVPGSMSTSMSEVQSHNWRTCSYRRFEVRFEVGAIPQLVDLQRRKLFQYILLSLKFEMLKLKVWNKYP